MRKEGIPRKSSNRPPAAKDIGKRWTSRRKLGTTVVEGVEHCQAPKQKKKVMENVRDLEIAEGGDQAGFKQLKGLGGTDINAGYAQKENDGTKAKGGREGN